MMNWQKMAQMRDANDGAVLICEAFAINPESEYTPPAKPSAAKQQAETAGGDRFDWVLEFFQEYKGTTVESIVGVAREADRRAREAWEDARLDLIEKHLLEVGQKHRENNGLRLQINALQSKLDAVTQPKTDLSLLVYAATEWAERFDGGKDQELADIILRLAQAVAEIGGKP